MRKVAVLLAASAATIVATISGAYACGEGKVQFEDTFDELDPSWGNGGDQMQIVDGQLHIIATTPQTFRAISSFGFYDDADICVTTTLIKDPRISLRLASSTGTPMRRTSTGSTAGTYVVFRLMKNRWVTGCALDGRCRGEERSSCR